jgi:high-affinity iron transporter
VVALISEVNASELAIQAVTGLLAIVVLLVVMNWFFHKIYWTGWISHHNDRRRRVLGEASETGRSPYLGLALLGFTAIYREGFEVVLFLQNLRLRAGTSLVMKGTAVGLGLTAIVAVLTFVAHKRLPYKRMLIITGVMLGGVLLVMVGESVQEMQQAGWLSTTPLGVAFPPWLGLWFSLFPNIEGLAAQGLAATLVIGSYYLAEHRQVPRQTIRPLRREVRENRTESEESAAMATPMPRPGAQIRHEAAMLSLSYDARR